MDKYLRLLKRRLVRANNQIKKRMTDSEGLSPEGFRVLGYYEGRVSILEDAIDEIENNFR